MILQASYGYDMTINHYYKVLKLGDKTIVAQEIGKIVKNDDGFGRGTSIADESKVIGEPFRAKKKIGYDGRTYFVSYHFAGGDAEEWDGKEDYYNTWD